jgi:predicted nucleic acid-binding protein
VDRERPVLEDHAQVGVAALELAQRRREPGAERALELTYVLDTNVVSELRKARAGKAEPSVATWAASVPASSLYLSAITILELEIGVLLVERRDPVQGPLLRRWLAEHVLPAFTERVLPVDTTVA